MKDTSTRRSLSVNLDRDRNTVFKNNFNSPHVEYNNLLKKPNYQKVTRNVFTKARQIRKDAYLDEPEVQNTGKVTTILTSRKQRGSLSRNDSKPVESKTESFMHRSFQKRMNQIDVLKAVEVLKSEKSFSSFDQYSSSLASIDSLNFESMVSDFNKEKFENMKKTYSQTNHRNLEEFLDNRNSFKTGYTLRYRENIFRVASKLIAEMPPFPHWAYLDEDLRYLNIMKVNVGGHVFYIFKDAISKLMHTKIAKCLMSHSSFGIPFFDRDYICFNAILNFFRTGRLHLPPNTCPILFEEELQFWGIHEEFMEPCCWSEYECQQNASNTLKKYAEDNEKDEYTDNIQHTYFQNLRKRLYLTITSGSGSVYSRWVSTIITFFVVISIMGMIIGSTPFGRINITGNGVAEFKQNETVSEFFTRTKIVVLLQHLELLISGFFLSELIFRVIVCPNRLELFSDTLNWIDLIATSTTLISNMFSADLASGSFEGYLLLLKLPRTFRLFKLTANLRTGIDAFVLTMRASSNELKLIFLILFIMMSVFGSLIFVVEMVNENNLASEKSDITNVYFGMWWAIVTMSTCGFGDLVPKTTVGYLLGAVTIMIGVIICQLPVPIVLKNFVVYNNQGRARLNHKPKFIFHHIDPESAEKVKSLQSKAAKKERKEKNFKKMFHKLM